MCRFYGTSAGIVVFRILKSDLVVQWLQKPEFEQGFTKRVYLDL